MYWQQKKINIQIKLARQWRRKARARGVIRTGYQRRGGDKKRVSRKGVHETENFSIKDTTVFLSSFALFFFFWKDIFSLVLTENYLKMAGL